MELSTITMEPQAAQTAYEEYAAAVRANHADEDRAIADGYRALAEGKQLVELSKCVAAGGVTKIEARSRWRNQDTTVTVPRLAFCRADARMAYTTGVDQRGGCLITADKRERELHVANAKDRNRIADGTFAAAPNEATTVRAIVPGIPPRLRPKRGLQLYTVLWEAEWSVDPKAPVDPALLRRLGGDLYIVLGVWDLTALEQAVLVGRGA